MTVIYNNCQIYTLGGCSALTDGQYLYFEEDDGRLVPIDASDDSELLRGDARDGRLAFSVDGKFGIVDVKTSHVTVQPVWDYVGEYACGLAWVYRTDEDTVGLDPRFAAVSRGSKAHIDLNGELLSELIPFDNTSRRAPEEALRLAKRLLDCGDYYFADELLCEAGDSGDAKALRARIQWKCCRGGKRVCFGRYVQKRQSRADTDEILWIVRAIEGGKALLVSEKSIDALPYHTGGAPVTWESSTLRAWLNHDFLHTAFSEVEQRCIFPAELQNSISFQKINLSGGADTVDRVFIPGWMEEQGEAAEATEYAQKKLGLPPQTKKTELVPHLLRWPTPEGRYSACTVPGRTDMLFGINDAETVMAVRPMLWVDLEGLRGGGA